MFHCKKFICKFISCHTPRPSATRKIESGKCFHHVLIWYLIPAKKYSMYWSQSPHETLASSKVVTFKGTALGLTIFSSLYKRIAMLRFMILLLLYYVAWKSLNRSANCCYMYSSSSLSYNLPIVNPAGFRYCSLSLCWFWEIVVSAHCYAQ